jgi:hypothetical protein
MTDLFSPPTFGGICNAAAYKIVVEALGSSFEREFASLKALRQFERRNKLSDCIPYVWHNDQWERFVIYGSQVIPKSILQSLLNSLNS